MLDEEHLLKEEFHKEFDIGKKSKRYGVAYFDTAEREFQKEGWFNRIRKKEDTADKGYELTFKKRYSVPDEDIGAAMGRVEADGFDLASGVWATEIEWNYSGMILSVSAEAKSPADGHGSLAELDRADAVKKLWDNMPVEEKGLKSGQ